MAKDYKKSTGRKSNRVTLRGRIQKIILQKVTNTLLGLRVRLLRKARIYRNRIAGIRLGLDTLPTEIVITIAEQLDITTRQGINGFISLTQTCKTLHSTLDDKIVITRAVQMHQTPIIKAHLRNLRLYAIEDAQDLVVYREKMWWLYRLITPFMDLIPGHMSSWTDLNAHKGWESIFTAAFWVRAGIFGSAEIHSSTRTSTLQTLSPAQTIVLWYAALIFQECYVWKVQTMLDDYRSPEERVEHLRQVRTAFLGQGPQGALQLLEGTVLYYPTEEYPHEAHTAVSVFKRLVEPEIVHYASYFGEYEPEKYIRTKVENNMKEWSRQNVFDDDKIFEALGISEKGIATLRQSFKLWCKATHPGEMLWYMAPE